VRSRAALAIAAVLLPAVAAAQVVLFGSAPEPGGSVEGRVCLDRNADGLCGAEEPGVAGARLIAEGGQAAIADGAGRYHFLEVPGRTLLPDRVAYGGHVVAVEGLGARRSFELSPGGAARVDLAVPAPDRVSPPPLAAAGAPGGAPELLPGGRLRWSLGGRTTPGARVAIGLEASEARKDGSFAADVVLSPGENVLGAAVVAPDGGGAIFAWTVVLASRSAGGALVVPGRPERLAALDAVPGSGGGWVLAGRVAPPSRIRVGGVVVEGDSEGDFAAWVPPGAEVEIVGRSGGTLVRVRVPGEPARGLSAAVALAELEVSFFGEPGLLVTARGAGAARGTLGPFAYEVGLDLDDRDRRGELADLLRPRVGLAAEHALDPERSLPSGDEGASGDLNPGRGRLWARVEGEGARLDLGAIRSGLEEGELGRYERALSGARVAGGRSVGPVRVEASAFGATARDDANGNPPPAAAHDVLGGTGGAALWLAHGAVVPGSESLRLEWRDPTTGRVTSRRVLVRGKDYEIDWASGRVVLAVPLSSVGGAPYLATADPFAAPRAAVRADYLHASAARGGEDVQGARLGAALGPLALSVHGANEERAGGGYRLLAGAATLDLGPLLRARAEAARSRGSPFGRAGAVGLSRSSDGGYAFSAPTAPGAEAEALHVDVRGAAGGLRYEGWWRERDAGYADGEFSEEGAARERGVEAALDAGPFTASVLYAERRGVEVLEPGAGLLDDRRALARVGWRGGRLSLAAEGLRVERGSPVSEETSAGLRATWSVDPALSLDVSHHQGLRTTGAGRDPTFTAAGATWTHGRTALSVRGGWGPEVGPRVLVGGERSTGDEVVYGTFSADPDAPSLLPRAASALGARRRDGDTELFVEEQFARDAFGLRAGRVFGASVRPLHGLRLSLSGERGERLRLDGSRADRNAVAGTAGYLAGPIRLAARGEVLREGSDGQAAAGGSAEWVVAPGAVLALRASFVEGSFAGREGLALDASLSGALRAGPSRLLATVSRIVEMRPGEARRDGVVVRLAATFEAARRLALGLGAGLALQETAGVRDDRISGSARARVRIAGPFDAAVEYARRAPLGGGALGSLDAVRAEVGVSERESRLAIGYTLLGFGGDGLAPASDTGRLHVRAQFAY